MPADLMVCDKFLVYPSVSTEPGRPNSLPMRCHIPQFTQSGVTYL